MKRREVIILGGGVLASWPLAARAQQPSIPRLGILLYSDPQVDPNTAAMIGALRDLGYVEARTITIDFRYAAGKPDRLPQLARELVALRPDAIVAFGGDVAGYVVEATRTLPLVFISSADPVQLGYAASLARPGANATGVTLLLDELASKRMQLLKEAAPHISRVAFIWNPDHPDNEIVEAERAARALAISLVPIAIRRIDDLDDALRATSAAGANALYVVSSRLTVFAMARIVGFAAKNQLPLAGGWGAWANAGGLLSYGPNVEVMARAAAGFVDKILRGAKPADLPVQQPTRFELIINLKTAKAIGLTISAALLDRADGVIE